ncbi:uncharacterized protein LOC117633222 isoform X1 [Prunus dulcis]|nr:uncharacterized protein LOC117633222 isoform X1 [Prunus dulcis]XP_034222830.1 uncharacterized protein LOC117633222 isoform X1 [Prunus dulcis]XP_034222832.1 uncharacterized protein LOC117633222 isoform X1 [Prunus dulcis]
MEVSQMESAQPDRIGDCIKETSIKHLFYPGTPDISNVFGEQQVSPRVGDEYQVEIPLMNVEAEKLKLLTNPADSKVVDVSHDFLVGLPVPIIWSDEVKNIEDKGLESPTNPDDAVNAKRSQETRNGKKNRTRIKKKSSELKVEPLEFGLAQGEESRAENLGLRLVEEDSNQSIRTKCCYPVPGSSRSPWSDAEVDGFLLGLYIFGKNFYQVQRFIEHKDMGEILSFYYGKFYRSESHRRWSECRKIRRKKCITGEKIFTGWRQRELLSRLVPQVPEEFQRTLSEGYKSFAEGKTSLEEYVSLLKSTVGIHVLVETIGIGKGKEDLTGFAMEPGKNNQDFPVCPKLPTGKAFSSLTFSEIMKCLTGGFRLSKARCNDIFWEAVWPRLLANGWHSEQPKNHGYVSFKHSLVFLMPGIKKFSRKKLIKGEHYFDSVSDVLSKVASEPELLRLEAEEGPVGSWNEEGGWVPEATSDQDDQSNYRRHCYLKPRIATSNPNHMKFTVVDTSLVHGGKSCGIVQLRCSPVEFEINSTQTNCSNENEVDACENKLNEYENDTAEMRLSPKTNMAKHLNQRRFTVVDTSLVHGGKSSKVRELRCSPAVVTSVSKSTGLLQEAEGNSKDLLGKHMPDATDISLNDEVNNFSSNCRTDTTVIGGTNQMATINNTDTAEKLESQLDKETRMSDNKQPKKTALHQFKRRAKYSHSNSIGPLKRRRLTACVKAETSCLVKNCSEDLESESHGTLNSLDGVELVVSLVGPQEKESSITSLAPVKESSLGTLRGNSSGVHMSHGENEKHQTPESSNLNLPQDSMDSRNSENFVVFSQETNADSPCLSSSGMKHVDDDALGASNMNSRRQSTRNRPPTTRALEALADGFFSVKRRKKGTEVPIREKPPSRSSRKAHSRVKVTSSHADTVSGVVASKEEKEVNEAFNVNKETVSKPLDQIGEKWLTGY